MEPLTTKPRNLTIAPVDTSESEDRPFVAISADGVNSLTVHQQHSPSAYSSPHSYIASSAYAAAPWPYADSIPGTHQSTFQSINGRFLGCFAAAETSCCGCTLQNAVYYIALISLVIGTLNLVGAMVHLTADSLVMLSSITVVYAILQIILGYIAWKAASELRVDYAQLTLIIFLLAIAVTIVHCCAGIEETLTPTYRTALYHNLEERLIKQTGHPLTIKENRDLEKDTALYIMYIIVGILLELVAMIIFAFYMSYIIWSFKVRVKEGDLVSVTVGIPLPSERLYPSWYRLSERDERLNGDSAGGYPIEYTTTQCPSETRQQINAYGSPLLQQPYGMGRNMGDRNAPSNIPDGRPITLDVEIKQMGDDRC